MRLYPAIDIMDGQCVRLEQGDFAKNKVYFKNPLEAALQYEDYGMKYLHIVDLDGAREGKLVNYKIIAEIAERTELVINCGGGIKKEEDFKIAFDSGVSQVIIGSMAVKDPDNLDRIGELYGKNKIIIGADVKDELIAISGWKELTETNVFDFVADYYKKGFDYFLVTDISKDGMLVGPSFDLYRRLSEKVLGINLFASGGVSGIRDLEILEQNETYAVIIGKALYENKISLHELKNFVEK